MTNTTPTDLQARMEEEWALVNRLRDQEADSVTILCDNPDGPPNNAVECCGFWTGFAERRFEGETITSALRSAVEAKGIADRDGHPEITSSPMKQTHEADKLYEALEWAIADIEGRTRYTADYQQQNCVDMAHDALSAYKRIKANRA